MSSQEDHTTTGRQEVPEDPWLNGCQPRSSYLRVFAPCPWPNLRFTRLTNGFSKVENLAYNVVLYVML